MAARGAFAILRHNVVASLTKGLRGKSGCALQNRKSTRRRLAVYLLKSSAALVGKLPATGIQCLNSVRATVMLGGERLARHVIWVESPAGVTHRSRTFPVGLV